MTDIFEVLRNLENVQQNKMHFVYYDPITRKVIHVRNYKEQDAFPCFETDSPLLLDETRNISDFSVIEKNGKLELTKVERGWPLFDVNDAIHKIPKTKMDINEIDWDILIRQDNKNKKFYIRLSDSMISKLGAALQDEPKRILMYITEEGDPNVLYSKIDIDTRAFVYGSIEIDFDDYDGILPCTIVTKKIFENYIYLDLR